MGVEGGCEAGKELERGEVGVGRFIEVVVFVVVVGDEIWLLVVFGSFCSKQCIDVVHQFIHHHHRKWYGRLDLRHHKPEPSPH